jgi:hypothetical protein
MRTSPPKKRDGLCPALRKVQVKRKTCPTTGGVLMFFSSPEKTEAEKWTAYI